LALYLTVLDNRKQVIFSSKEKLNPASGTIDFQDVTITVVQGRRSQAEKNKGERRKEEVS
jgi:hypothetical protein